MGGLSDNSDNQNSDGLNDTIRAEKRLEQKILLASQVAEPGEAVLGGYHALGTAAGKHGTRADKQDKKFRELQATLIADEIAKLQAELDVLYEQRDELLDDMREIDRQRLHLRELRGMLADGDLPELDADGKIRNPQLEALIVAYEKRSGHSVDRTDARVLDAIIAAELMRLDEAHEAKRAELARIQGEIDEREARINELRGERDMEEPGDERLAERKTAFADVRQADAQSADFAPKDEFSGMTL